MAEPIVILQDGVRRIALQRAVTAALAALGISVVAAALLIFVVRLQSGPSRLITAGLILPPVTSLVVLLIGFFSRRPSLQQAALRLDRSAGTAEHLVTWLQWRDATFKNNDDLQRGFLLAQRAATVAKVQQLNARKVLPLAWPTWTRALWLALVLLCCALLTPPREAAQKVLPQSFVEKQRRRPNTDVSFEVGGSSGAQPQTPFVQVLSPTDKKLFQLLATDPDRTPAQQQQILKQLLGKIGNTAEKDLPPEVRELLAELRQQAGAKKSETDPKSGSVTATNNDAPQTATELNPAGVAAYVTTFNEKTFTAIKEQFPDVQENLKRYYHEP